MINWSSIIGSPRNTEYTDPLRSRLPLSQPAPQTGGGLPPSSGTPQGVHTGGPGQVFPAPPPNVGTGGVDPPYPGTPSGVHTGGPLPPLSGTPTGVHTGGPLPPTSGTPLGVHTGGPLPPNGNPGIVPPWLQNVQTGGPNPPQPAPQPNVGSMAPVDVVQQMIDGMMKGQYGQNARQSGLDLAADRGLLNSSLAAGNAQRAALEGITPFVQQGMGLLGQRESNAFQGEQNQLDRNLRQKMQSDAVFQQDWLSNRDFNRNFYGQISMLPIQNAAQFSQMIAQYALENPEVYTPDNIAGMSQFFNNSFRDILSSYLHDINLGGP